MIMIKCPAVGSAAMNSHLLLRGGITFNLEELSGSKRKYVLNTSNRTGSIILNMHLCQWTAIFARQDATFIASTTVSFSRKCQFYHICSPDRHILATVPRFFNVYVCMYAYIKPVIHTYDITKTDMTEIWQMLSCSQTNWSSAFVMYCIWYALYEVDKITAVTIQRNNNTMQSEATGLNYAKGSIYYQASVLAELNCTAVFLSSSSVYSIHLLVSLLHAFIVHLCMTIKAIIPLEQHSSPFLKTFHRQHPCISPTLPGVLCVSRKLWS